MEFILGLYWLYLGVIMEKQVEKQMDNEIQTGV